jgi:hypothetical protein
VRERLGEALGRDTVLSVEVGDGVHDADDGADRRRAGGSPRRPWRTIGPFVKRSTG